ncbi:MAG: hypothetical protein A2Z34_03525 [Planctomycetes bacterium RBG_16_59_8]|nr:MAG: hypothetical protein A2Z34_03525 [Planctomycetes bacterium RBG_16_59_8]
MRSSSSFEAQAAAGVGVPRQRDRGARNLSALFFAVVGGLLCFYVFLTYRALTWSPMFAISGVDSEKSRVLFVDRRREGSEKVSDRRSEIVARGKSLYLRSGCALCHGVDGRGDVKNPNYIKEEKSPALNVIAERMFLHEREDVEAVIAVLASGKPLDEVEELDVPRSAAVIAQYKSIRNIVFAGNPAGKKDPNGKKPFDMPPWKERLSESQFNDIIAYLLSLSPWESN